MSVIRTVALLLVCVTLSSGFLTRSLSKRKEKGKSGWSENWQSWSDEGSDSCSCDCKKKQETVAIVIPKYEFVDIPTAKEVSSKQVIAPQSMYVSTHGGSPEPDFDETDEHNHQVLESMDLRRTREVVVRRPGSRGL